MPDGQLHQISEAIGELRAEIRSSAGNVDRLETKIDAVAKSVSAVRADFDQTKNRGWGLIIGLTFLSGALGGKVSAAIQKLFFVPLFVICAAALVSCTSPTAPTLDDAREDALSAVLFAAPTSELRAIRSTYALGAVANYAAHAIERYSGPSAAADAERFLFRLDETMAGLGELRSRSEAGRSRHFVSAFYALDVIDLAELAIEPTVRTARDRVLGLAAAPQPLAIARSAGEALRQIARVEFVREALVADAREHAAELAARGAVGAADWQRALEPIVHACMRLAGLARRDQRRLPTWCVS